MVKPLEKACCMELRTAGLIIGWLGVFGSVLGFCNAVFILVQAAHSFIDEKTDFFVTGGQWMVASILTAVISGLLIYGIKKIRYSMLLPWLVLNTFSLVLNYFGLLTYLLSFVATTSLYDFVIFLLLVFSVGPSSYIYYVIYSLYTHMKMDFGMCRVFTPPPAAEVQLKQNDPASYI